MGNRYTDGTYLAGNPGWHEYGSSWKARKIAEVLVRRDLRPTRIAEVGCGAGGVLAALQDRLPSDVEFRGFDISPQAISIASAKANDRLRYVNGDFLTIDDTFDLVLAVDVFEHVEDYFHFLRAVRERGRTHIFHVPLELSCYTLYRHQSLLQTRQRVGHIHFYWKDLAIASIEDCGYRVLETSYTSPPGETQHDLPLPPVRSRELAIVNGLSRLVYRFDPDRAIRWFGGSSMLVLAQPA